MNLWSKLLGSEERRNDGRQYWATLGKDQIGEEIWARIEDYYECLASDGFFSRMQKSYNAYYGLNTTDNASGRYFNSHMISRGGRQGETYDLKVNSFRSGIQHLLVMVTSERPAYETMASNTDYKSQTQAELGDGLLEYYATEKRMDRTMVEACEIAIWASMAHVSVTWDTSLGRLFREDPETGRQVFEGDMRYDVHTPADCGCDPGVTDAKNPPWRWVRRVVNKWDLIAENPELEEKIHAIDNKLADLQDYAVVQTLNNTESDMIYVFDWYHGKSSALREGRMVSVLPGGDVFFDGPLPYQKIPIYTIMPSKMGDTGKGYTAAFDMLSIQEGLDILYSAVLTNLASSGISNIGVPKGHDFRVQSLGGGLNIIEFDPNLGPPVPINLTEVPRALIEMIPVLEKAQEQQIGLNSVVRGDPEGALKGSSGAAMALLASQAIQFSYGLQREYEYLHEDVGTATLKTLQQYATTERVAMISGKSKRAYLKEFKGDDLSNIDRVVVKRSSALSKTTAGKAEIAKDLLDNGMIRSPEEYINVLKTGNLETVTERPRTKYLNIRRENEKMREGEQVFVLATDNHVDHIAEHMAILDDPDAREDPRIVNIVLQHVEEHQMAWASTNPNLLAATGQQPPPMPMQPGFQGGMPPGPPQPQGGGNSPDVQQTQGERLADQMPRMPGMPNLPGGAPAESQQAYDQMKDNVPGGAQ